MDIEQQQQQQEDNLFDAAQEMITNVIALNAEPHGTLVIPGQDWSDTLRENSGGAVDAISLHDGSLWDTMLARFQESGALETMEFTRVPYCLTVTW